jgi:hypothetical protein
MILILNLRKNQSTIDYKISTTDFDQKIVIRVRLLFHGGDFHPPRRSQPHVQAQKVEPKAQSESAPDGPAGTARAIESP